jgi:dihydroxyacid dehydratase/phosphogluconate dehydratase
MTQKLNRYSSRITQPKSQGASQAMLHATGLRDEDMDKPQAGISSVWFEGNPCNMHLLALAEKVKEGIAAAGLVGLRFNTIGVSDGISMGTNGMSYSLQSRDLIADSIETVMSAQWYDANVSIPGCDKNMPGCVIAMGRLNRPALMIYGAPFGPGTTGAGSSTSFPRFRAMASSSPDTSTMPRAGRSCAIPALAREHAEECTPRTQWLRLSRLWDVAPVQFLDTCRASAQAGRVFSFRRGDPEPFAPKSSKLGEHHCTR